MPRPAPLPERLGSLEPFRKRFATLPPKELNEDTSVGPLFALLRKGIEGHSTVEAEKLVLKSRFFQCVSARSLAQGLSGKANPGAAHIKKCVMFSLRPAGTFILQPHLSANMPMNRCGMNPAWKHSSTHFASSANTAPIEPARPCAVAESQRDSVPKPRVARDELPWETSEEHHNPNGVVDIITCQIKTELPQPRCG